MWNSFHSLPAEVAGAPFRLDTALDILEEVLRACPVVLERFLKHRTVMSRRFAFFLGQRDGADSLRGGVAIFELDDDLAIVTMKDLIDKLVEDGVFKESCQFIAALRLQHLYSPEQVFRIPD